MWFVLQIKRWVSKGLSLIFIPLNKLHIFLVAITEGFHDMAAPSDAQNANITSRLIYTVNYH